MLGVTRFPNWEVAVELLQAEIITRELRPEMQLLGCKLSTWNKIKIRLYAAHFYFRLCTCHEVVFLEMAEF